MAETPTPTYVIEIRPDIESRLSSKLSLADYLAKALAQVKRDVEDKKGIKWSQVYDSANTAYFDNADSTGRNDDRLKHAIALQTISLIFKDYSINSGDEGKWWGLYEAYRVDYENLIDTMVLDVDLDESGAIDDGEESQTQQVFLGK